MTERATTHTPSERTVAAVRAVVFDLGGVLIHWDPRRLYRKLFSTEAEVDHFLDHVCSPEWNAKQDAGRSHDDGIAELSREFPEEAVRIAAWRDRFGEMLSPMEDSIAILQELHERGTPLYVISNWGAQTFDGIWSEFPFLTWFRALVISGRVGLAKPDPRIFELLLREQGLEAGEVIFIDDHPPNIEAAQRVGFETVHFRSAQALRRELTRFELL